VVSRNSSVPRSALRAVSPTPDNDRRNDGRRSRSGVSHRYLTGACDADAVLSPMMSRNSSVPQSALDAVSRALDTSWCPAM